jgi:ABC-type phosphate transport system substrate-binding protein
MNTKSSSRGPRRIAGALLPLLSFALVSALALGALPASGFHRSAPNAVDVAVIVHPGVSESGLSYSELRKIMMGDRQFWTSSLRVTLLIRAPVSRERDVLLKKVYQMTEPQFRQYWIGKVFRAEATSGPKVVYSNQAATEQVASTPGGIAFVDASQVPKGVKVLKIDGHAPGDKEYTLR